MPTFDRFPLLGLRLKELGEELERSFLSTNSPPLGLSSWSRNLLARARAGLEANWIESERSTPVRYTPYLRGVRVPFVFEGRLNAHQIAENAAEPEFRWLWKRELAGEWGRRNPAAARRAAGGGRPCRISGNQGRRGPGFSRTTRAASSSSPHRTLPPPGMGSRAWSGKGSVCRCTSTGIFYFTSSRTTALPLSLVKPAAGRPPRYLRFCFGSLLLDLNKEYSCRITQLRWRCILDGVSFGITCYFPTRKVPNFYKEDAKGVDFVLFLPVSEGGGLG
ncbi:hypothetical protein Taro_005309 [Colocasia esculenta]|uniref:Uncharacterized protein n=1 Tax=Colocasia esculenta TaxID=4460 RepID=A0A843TS15_COLES|nr:hypothetical protein [Colocasia esculenta]